MDKETIKTRLITLETLLNISSKKEKITVIEEEMNSPEFWLEDNDANEKSKELKYLNDEVSKFEDLVEMVEIANDEELPAIELEVADLERFTFFSGKYDQSPAVINFYSGAGGDDAQDWTWMLMQMYIKWAENKNFTVSIIAKTEGGIAGIKNATIKIDGHYAYGMLKRENGVHRLVRQSPFNAKSLRQTSFSLVEVMPEIEKFKSDFEIPESDLRVDTFRSSGHGGQSVNTTDSAVRITHIPTGIVVTCQNEKSQLQNKALAMSVLRSRLAKLLEEQHKERIDELKGESSEPEWGSQIRSYVLHPYKLVKDHRTSFESKDPEGVLDGNLDEFIDAELRTQGRLANESN